ncbi:MAG: hypothetical protein RLZZ182_1841 [Pseudomonadota bacterium]|jgi:hypothetical protein
MEIRKAVIIDAAGFYIEDAPTVDYDPENPPEGHAPGWSVGVHIRPRWNGTEWVEGDQDAPAKLAAMSAAGARAWRDLELRATDWTQVEDAPGNKAGWKTYRQALRDWPQAPGFPTTKPVRPQ